MLNFPPPFIGSSCAVISNGFRHSFNQDRRIVRHLCEMAGNELSVLDFTPLRRNRKALFII